MKEPRNYQVSSSGPGSNCDNGSGLALGGRITSVLNVTLQGQTCPPCATWRRLESSCLGNKNPSVHFLGCWSPWGGWGQREGGQEGAEKDSKITEVRQDRWRSSSVKITHPQDCGSPVNTSESPEEGTGA